jgi:hypothetical protein
MDDGLERLRLALHGSLVARTVQGLACCFAVVRCTPLKFMPGGLRQIVEELAQRAAVAFAEGMRSVHFGVVEAARSAKVSIDRPDRLFSVFNSAKMRSLSCGM